MVLKEGELNNIFDDDLEDSISTLPKHLPITVYINYHDNIMAAIAFIELYGADGLNSNLHNITGFQFRSTEFAWLHKFLLKCGVQEPRLHFYKSHRISDTYRAGHFGVVTWSIIQNGPLKTAREALCLPSSNITNTDTSKEDIFTNELSLLELVILILYWIAGDGYVGYCHINKGAALPFTNLFIASRDRPIILALMQQALQAFGVFKTNITKSWCLFVSKDFKCHQVIMETLKLIPADCLHGKLVILQQVLETGTQGIPLSHGPPRAFSFFQYLGEYRQDKMACDLAQ